MNKRPLFNKYDLRGALEAQHKKLDARIADLTSESVLTADLEQLGKALLEEYRANPLVINEDGVSVEQSDVKLELRGGDFDRGARDGSSPYLVDGIRVRYYVPFQGDEPLLDCQPSTFTHAWPRVADVEGGELIFEYDRPDRSVDASKAEFEQDLRLFKQWLGWSDSEVRMFNDTLPPRIKTALATRRDVLERGRGDVEKLGYKVRAPAKPAPAPWQPPVQTPAPARRAKSAQPFAPRKKAEYDVALSFAGEDREYVERVADVLRQAGVRVFYHHFEEVELWGKDLAEQFAHIYGDGSRFIVLFTSARAAQKAWPTYERRQALARSIRDHETVVVLPVRFDDTEVPGLTDARAYLDARKLTPAELAERIKAKIQLER